MVNPSQSSQDTERHLDQPDDMNNLHRELPSAAQGKNNPNN